MAGQDLIYGKKYTIKSSFLKEERPYWVGLPSSYDHPNFGPQKYPVIYILDGKSNFLPLVGIIDFMSGRESVNYQIPEMIVVGIDTSDRLRDLTPSPASWIPGAKQPAPSTAARGGGGKLFLKFLAQELIPKIEDTYRTLPYRVCVGHSLGGLATTYSLLYQKGLFDGYLAIDPSLWWNNSRHVTEAPGGLKNLGTQKILRYYLSVIDLPEPDSLNFHLKSIEQFGDILKANATSNLKWKLHKIPGTDHSSIPLLSWYHGLQFVFSGYDLDHYAPDERSRFD